MRYFVRVHHVVAIDAENVAHALGAAKKLRLVGTGYGRRKPGPHDRDLVACNREVVSSGLALLDGDPRIPRLLSRKPPPTGRDG